jgi:hypothetical protein
MYDHPSLPMAGDCYQLLELQCHSKLAGRRIQRPKKVAKGETLEDNVDATPAQRCLQIAVVYLWISVIHVFSFAHLCALQSPALLITSAVCYSHCISSLLTQSYLFAYEGLFVYIFFRQFGVPAFMDTRRSGARIFSRVEPTST